MTAMAAVPDLLGARITAVAAPDAILSWLFDSSDAPAESGPIGGTFALCRCTDTLVWGVLEEAGWLWASDVDESLRRPSARTLNEARIFCHEHEIMLWRRCDPPDVQFAGRILADSLVACDDVTSPINRKQEFNGTQRKLNSGAFRFYDEPGGDIHIVPAGLNVEVRHYLQQCSETGTLRIAASRMMPAASDEGESNAA